MKEEKDLNKKGRKRRFSKKGIFITLSVMMVILCATGLGFVQASQKPSFCSSCHNMETYYNSYIEEGSLAYKHAQEGEECLDCHEETIPQKIKKGVKQVTGNYEMPFEKRDFGTIDFCLDCHDFNEVKAKTDFAGYNPHDSNHGILSCNSCHNVHRDSEVKCQQCHTDEVLDELTSKLGSEWKIK